MVQIITEGPEKSIEGSAKSTEDLIKSNEGPRKVLKVNLRYR